ncbi:MAG: hypothetical protein EKK33_08995 [Bradyrhizobiaceae bacterium]|nr:MAG: hypothetical protein EKK33_08995 [Bradyrhizobiaceae bacterium]
MARARTLKAKPTKQPDDITAGMFAMPSPKPPRLDFQPIATMPEIETEAWQARRGAFIYTIAALAAPREGFDISISFRPDYLPKGPFESLDAAVAACISADLAVNN